MIHYFWFGNNKMPDLALKCIESWKKFCPDYEIKLWNEKNYDVTKNQYMYETYKSGKFGFTADFARLDVIYEYGGIYLDTDVELIKPIDNILNNHAFMGFETERTVALGLGFGAEAGNQIIYEMREVYKNERFIKPDGTLNLIPSPSYQTRVLKVHGLNSLGEEQIIDDLCHVYPKTVFNPCDMDTMKIDITSSTVSIHHYMQSWATTSQKRNTKLFAVISRVFGKKLAYRIKKIHRKMKK